MDGIGGYYIRLSSLPQFSSGDDTNYYVKAGEDLSAVSIRISQTDRVLQAKLGEALREALRVFRLAKGSNESVEKNFKAKLLFRLDKVFEGVPLGGGVKLVCTDVTKLQEYLFFYVAAILGVVMVVFYMVLPSSRQDNTIVSIQKFTAEFIGTFVLVFLGCGTAMTVGCDSVNGGGYILTALAFGLVIVAMAYSIGNISGCHINPAVSLAMLISKKMSIGDFWGYIVFQTLGAATGAGLLQYLFSLSGKSDMTGTYNAEGELTAWGLGANGLAGVNDSIPAAIIIEIVLTLIFVLAILGVTDSRFKHGSFGGIVIGFALVLVHIMGIGFTGTSVKSDQSINRH